MVTKRDTGSKAIDFRSAFNIYLTDFGTKLTLNRVTETLDGQGRVIDSSTVSSTIKVDIQWVTQKDLMHLNMGDVDIGDGMLFVKYNADIKLEDNVVFNDEKWRVTSKIESELVSGQETYEGYIIQKNA